MFMDSNLIENEYHEIDTVVVLLSEKEKINKKYKEQLPVFCLDENKKKSP